MAGEREEFHTEELYKLWYSYRYIVRVMKSMRLRWMNHLLKVSRNRPRWPSGFRVG